MDSLNFPYNRNPRYNVWFVFHFQRFSARVEGLSTTKSERCLFRSIKFVEGWISLHSFDVKRVKGKMVMDVERRHFHFVLICFVPRQGLLQQFETLPKGPSAEGKKNQSLFSSSTELDVWYLSAENCVTIARIFERKTFKKSTPCPTRK